MTQARTLGFTQSQPRPPAVVRNDATPPGTRTLQQALADDAAAWSSGFSSLTWWNDVKAFAKKHQTALTYAAVGLAAVAFIKGQK